MFGAFIMETGVIHSGSVLSTCTDMYATAQYSVNIRKDIQRHALFCCSQCKQQTRTWASSRVLVVGTWSVKSK